MNGLLRPIHFGFWILDFQLSSILALYTAWLRKVFGNIDTTRGPKPFIYPLMRHELLRFPICHLLFYLSISNLVLNRFKPALLHLKLSLPRDGNAPLWPERSSSLGPSPKNSRRSFCIGSFHYHLCTTSPHYNSSKPSRFVLITTYVQLSNIPNSLQ